MEYICNNYGNALMGVAVGAIGAYGLRMAKEKKCFPFACGMPAVEPIKLSKKLCQKDQILIDLLSSQDHTKEAWVVTNPDQHDNPIIYASSGFCELTGYKITEVVGRNCRFLQGEKTDKNDVSKIHNATQGATEAAVCILNYRKDGSTFSNQLYIAPLLTPDGQVAYYLGITHAKEAKEDTTTTGKK